jgi:hypothetical protein
MEMSTYGSDPLTPISHVVNHEWQREEKARADAKKAKQQQRRECRETHSLMWMQQEKEGLSLPPTIENTSSGSDDGVGWLDLEEEDEVPLATRAKGKEVVAQFVPSAVRARAAPTSAECVTLASEGAATGVRPAQGARRPHRPRRSASVRC